MFYHNYSPVSLQQEQSISLLILCTLLLNLSSDFRMNHREFIKSTESDLTGCFLIRVFSGGGGVLVLGRVFGHLTVDPSAFQRRAQCLMSAVGGQRL